MLICQWSISVHKALFMWTERRFHKLFRKLSSKLAWILWLSTKMMSCTSHAPTNDRWTWPQTSMMNRFLQSNCADESPIIFRRFRSPLLLSYTLDLWAVFTEQTRRYGTSSAVTRWTSGGSRFSFYVFELTMVNARIIFKKVMVMLLGWNAILPYFVTTWLLAWLQAISGQ